MATFNPLREGYRSTRALTAALHERDEHTRHHCDRVVDLAVRLSKAIGLDGPALDVIEICARFHDIGKIGIADSILLKPASFNDEEWRIMKTHSEIGERIILATELPGADIAARVVRHHHENYGGNGYPDGLKGEDIPVEARVIFIVDAYDAMRSPRPNRPTMDHDTVLSIMESENGWKFDPAIFKHFPATVKNGH